MAKKDAASRKPIPPESLVAKTAYEHYRDHGVGRSVRKTAEGLHKSSTLIGRWSRWYGWQDRVAEWDLRQEKARHKGAEKAAEEAAEKATFGRVVDLTVKRDAWLVARLETADLIEKQGKYLVSFPAVTEERTGKDGATRVTVMAADPRKHLAGARMILMADEMKSNAYRDAFAAWAPPEPLPGLAPPTPQSPITTVVLRLPGASHADADLP